MIIKGNFDFSLAILTFFSLHSEFTFYNTVFFCHGIKNKKDNCDFLSRNSDIFPEEVHVLQFTITIF